ncbi:MAG: ABC transporter permease [Pseudomonadales bacterium]|nr:ABC transporter permease [Pseudomonadales bacterium]MCP5172204.1 ABC transporter permease [Pseudomonadales bacterium]
MQLTDQIWFNGRVIWRQKVRTILLLLAVSIGVASVVMLTSLGEGARRYINDEFSSLGNRLLIVFPGRNETVGGQPPIYGTSPRDLTLEDALAMGRVPSINAVAPILAGTTPVSRESLSREVVVLGTTASFFPVRQVDVAKGNPLPDRAVKEALSVVVLGSDLKKELFGNNNAIGQWVRIADRRVRVIGVLADEGESMGVDMADIAIIPVPLAQQLFNTQALFRVILELQEGADEQLARRRLEQVIRNRHDGEDDITIVSQDSVLAAFNNILTALTLVIAAIAAISLIVAGILVMNISLISVRQRRQEIGLLKAIGGSGRQIRQLFLGESLLLVFLGSMVGVVFAYGAVYLARFLLPDFPLFPPYWAAPVATLTAMLSGLIFCWLPARKAAQLDPVLAMRG